MRFRVRFINCRGVRTSFSPKRFCQQRENMLSDRPPHKTDRAKHGVVRPSGKRNSNDTRASARQIRFAQAKAVENAARSIVPRETTAERDAHAYPIRRGPRLTEIHKRIRKCPRPLRARRFANKIIIIITPPPMIDDAFFTPATEITTITAHTLSAPCELNRIVYNGRNYTSACRARPP